MRSRHSTNYTTPKDTANHQSLTLPRDKLATRPHDQQGPRTAQAMAALPCLTPRGSARDAHQVRRRVSAGSVRGAEVVGNSPRSSKGRSGNASGGIHFTPFGPHVAHRTPTASCTALARRIARLAKKISSSGISSERSSAVWLTPFQPGTAPARASRPVCCRL